MFYFVIFKNKHKNSLKSYKYQNYLLFLTYTKIKFVRLSNFSFKVKVSLFKNFNYDTYLNVKEDFLVKIINRRFQNK